MQIIKNNPYRIVGLLVGASAREQHKQEKKLKQYIEAEQEPENDFSFPTFSELRRTLDSVTDAISKLELDFDRMNAALFWFYKGNEVTDEPAFDLLKDGNIKESASIWSKLTNNKQVEHKNASAFHNLSTLMLNYAIQGNKIKEDLLEKGIKLKLRFLNSDFIKDLKSLATDETFQISNKELQLLFLSQVHAEIEQHGGITSNKFLQIIHKQEFSAKEEFLKKYIQKPLEQIEKKIEESKKKRNGNDAKAGSIGNLLYSSINDDLAILKSILKDDDIKLISISDKAANEILQCSITLFNHFHETETEVGEIALDLNKKAKAIALGNIVKERINESTPIVERYIKDKPEREKFRKIKTEIEFISEQLDKFQRQPDSITIAKRFAEVCKPRIIKIKNTLGGNDDIYLSLSSTIVQNVQNILVAVVNKEANNPILHVIGTSLLKTTITDALEVTFLIGNYGMYPNLKSNYLENLDGLKSIARQLNISTLSPKEVVQQEIRAAENRLKEIEKQEFFKSEIYNARIELANAKQWHFLRSQADRIQQIAMHESTLNHLLSRSENEKNMQKISQQNKIAALKTKLQKMEY